jgi:RHS repeat-associated protein
VQQDANWNVTAVVDASGNVAERYVYDPYGGATVLAPDWSSRGTSLFGWIYLHQGGRFDTTSGLYYFRNRDYSPTLGRWMELDPLGYSGGDNNLYRYEQNGPTNSTDSTGEYPQVFAENVDINPNPILYANGGFQWFINWKLTEKAPSNGFVIQYIKFKADVKPVKPPQLVALEDISDYYEAWPVTKGKDRTDYFGRTGFDDVFGIPSAQNGSSGTINATGIAIFIADCTAKDLKDYGFKPADQSFNKGGKVDTGAGQLLALSNKTNPGKVATFDDEKVLPAILDDGAVWYTHSITVSWDWTNGKPTTVDASNPGVPNAGPGGISNPVTDPRLQFQTGAQYINNPLARAANAAAANPARQKMQPRMQGGGTGVQRHQMKPKGK